MHMPICGHTFFGHNPSNVGPIGKKFSVETQETINYRLVKAVRLKFQLLIFLTIFSEEMGLVTTQAQEGLGRQNLTNMLTNWVYLLG